MLMFRRWALTEIECEFDQILDSRSLSPRPNNGKNACQGETSIPHHASMPHCQNRYLRHNKELFTALPLSKHNIMVSFNTLMLLLTCSSQLGFSAFWLLLVRVGNHKIPSKWAYHPYDAGVLA